MAVHFNFSNLLHWDKSSSNNCSDSLQAKQQSMESSFSSRLFEKSAIPQKSPSRVTFVIPGFVLRSKCSVDADNDAKYRKDLHPLMSMSLTCILADSDMVLMPTILSSSEDIVMTNVFPVSIHSSGYVCLICCSYPSAWCVVVVPSPQLTVQKPPLSISRKSAMFPYSGCESARTVIVIFPMIFCLFYK